VGDLPGSQTLLPVTQGSANSRHRTGYAEYPDAITIDSSHLANAIAEISAGTPMGRRGKQGLRTTFSGPTHHFFLRF
jgi:hypothetical protein